MTPERIKELRAFINKPGLSGTEGVYIAQVETSDCLDTIESQAARIEELEALMPFADVAAHDISDDEADEDIFRPMSTQKIAVAPLLTVGHLRAARAALTKGE